MHSRRRLGVEAFLPVLCAAGTLHAATIRVPGDAATLEAALGVAAGGDSILVAAGSYDVETTVGVRVTILSESGSAVTTLTGAGAHRIFDSVDADLTLIGFTIENAGFNGHVAPSDYRGGAMIVSAGHTLLIEDCVFRNNKASLGACIYSDSDLTARRTRFELNSNGALTPSAVIQGGVAYLSEGTTATLEDCTFANNRSGQGGALFTFGHLVARRCAFEDNLGHIFGGAIRVVGRTVGRSSILLEDSSFERNWGSRGGGASFLSPGEIIVRRCNFSGNTGGQIGGGFDISGTGPAIVEDCTFVDNVAIGQGGGGLFVGSIQQGTSIQRCYFKSNATGQTGFDDGGAALWIIATGVGTTVLDCTFVDNEINPKATSGSVIQLESSAGGTTPVFERVIIAFNRMRAFACGVPTQSPVPVAIDCSLVFGNEPDDFVCGGLSGPDVINPRNENAVFCNPDHDSVCADSPAATESCGVMGGLPFCGNCAVPTLGASWGRIKSRFAPDAPAGPSRP